MVITGGGNAEPTELQPHLRTKGAREDLAKRFKSPNSGFDLVIVRDMWLTGFDAPALHTLYIDKPMQGHALMQAIARVNRVFGEKPGGLIVDYLGIGAELKAALAWGLFKPVVTDPATWTNQTVATSGQLWDIGYRFARPPNAVVEFRRSGRSLSISAAGSAVTLSTARGCTIQTATPATITLARHC